MNNNSSSGKALISEQKFKHTNERVQGGSSPVLGLFLDDNGQKWIGKCSMPTLTYGAFHGVKYYVRYNFDEFKECLANRLYNLFGVKTPETTLSLQYLNEEDQQIYSEQEIEDLEKPRMHLMSKFIENFQALGKKFLSDYKQNTPKKSHFCPNKESDLPLRGFGRVIVTAVLFNDYDCVGNSGGNMGYILNEENKCAEIVKIDPGEALPFATDVSKAEGLENDPQKKEAILGTGGSRLPFSALRLDDQKEFIQTAMEILEMPDSKIKEVFEGFLGLDKRFKTILERLLTRKKDLLNAFELEVRTLIEEELGKFRASKAEIRARDWGKSMQQSSAQDPPKKQILNNAQLDAFGVAKNQLFVGREAQLLQMNELFSNNQGVMGCAIVGSAGFGKSHLAAEYINRCEKRYSQVIRLNAEHDDLIPDQILIYLQTCFKVQQLDPKDKSKFEIIERLHQILNQFQTSAKDNNRKKFCIVFDNAANMSQISDYLPDHMIFPELNIDILVTARYQEWNEPFYKKIELQAFEVQETQSYIQKCLPNMKMEDDDASISSEIDKFNALLGGLPLAVSQAIAFIQQNDISISKFCHLVKEVNQKDEIMIGETEKRLKELNYVSPTLTLALADLRSKNPIVESILDIIAYISPDRISKSLLRKLWEECRSAVESMKLDRNENLSSENTSNQLNQGNWKASAEIKSVNEGKNSEAHLLQEFGIAFALLLSYSLVTPNTVNLKQTQSEEMKIEERSENEIEFKVHRLTQQVIRDNHKRSNIYEKRYENVFDRMLKGLDYKAKDMNDVQRAGLLVVHAMYLESLQNNIKKTKMAELFEKIGYHQLYGVGKYDIALKYFEKALEVKEEFYGKDHRETGLTLHNLGNVWGNLGKNGKQIDLLTRALEIKEKHYGRDHPQIGITLANLGMAWGSLGDYEKQRDFLTRALEIFEEHYDKDHPQTSITLDSLGNAWGSLGDYEKQKELLTRALEIKEKNYGKDHPSTGITLGNLANAWGDLGNYEKQKDFLTRALEIKEKHHGKDHPSTGTTLINLGNAWGSLGDYEKQKDLLTRALEIYEKLYGKDHPQIGITLTNLGNAWGSLGDYEKKRDLLTRALEIYEKLYGKDHPLTSITLGSLGNAWGSLGDYEKKKDLLTRALEISEKRYSKDHPSTGIILGGLGNAWGSLGDYEKQKDFLTRALEISEKHCGKDHPSTGIILDNLGNAWRCLRNYEKQKDFFTRALDIKEKHCGKDHPSTGITLTCLGNAMGSLGDYEKQKDYLTRALEISEKHYGKDHPQTGIALDNLGNAWGSLGDYEKQKDFLTRALEISEKHHGKDHPQTGIALDNLGNAWGSLGDYEKQKDFLTRALEISEKNYGKDHPSTGIPLSYLGNAIRSLGDYEKQKDYLTRALEITQNRHPSNHFQITLAEFALKSVLSKQTKAVNPTEHKQS